MFTRKASSSPYMPVLVFWSGLARLYCKAYATCATMCRGCMCGLKYSIAGVNGCTGARTDWGWYLQGWLHSILYVLFENAMSVVKLWAVIAGVMVCISP